MSICARDLILIEFFSTHDQAKYPTTLIVFDMSLDYILVAFIAVCINNVLVEALPFSTRIAFGYFVSCITLIFVLIFEIGWDVFDHDTGYAVTLLAVAVVAFGCTGEFLVSVLLGAQIFLNHFTLSKM